MVHDMSAGLRSRRPGGGAIVLAVVGAAVVSGGCEMPRMLESPRIPGVYRIDIQQGNVVDQTMSDQLEIGMERRKVRFILGTPLLVDSFNPDRWDYLYVLRPGSGPEVSQRLSVYFVDDELARIEDRLDPGVVEGEERTQMLVKVPAHRARQGILYKLIPDFATPSDKRTVDDPITAQDEEPAAAADPPEAETE